MSEREQVPHRADCPGGPRREQPAVTTLITSVPPRKAPGAVPVGPVGRCLARGLLDRGESVRALCPRSEAPGWPPGVEIIEGSVLRPAEAPSAFVGIDRLFLAGATREVRTERPYSVSEVVSRAVEGGARAIVVLSSHGPVFEMALPPEQWHWLAVERAVEAFPVAPARAPVGVLAEALTSSAEVWPPPVEQPRASGSRRPQARREAEQPCERRSRRAPRPRWVAFVASDGGADRRPAPTTASNAQLLPSTPSWSALGRGGLGGR